MIAHRDAGPVIAQLLHAIPIRPDIIALDDRAAADADFDAEPAVARDEIALSCHGASDHIRGRAAPDIDTALCIAQVAAAGDVRTDEIADNQIAIRTQGLDFHTRPAVTRDDIALLRGAAADNVLFRAKIEHDPGEPVAERLRATGVEADKTALDPVPARPGLLDIDAEG